MRSAPLGRGSAAQSPENSLERYLPCVLERLTCQRLLHWSCTGASQDSGEVPVPVVSLVTTGTGLQWYSKWPPLDGTGIQWSLKWPSLVKTGNTGAPGVKSSYRPISRPPPPPLWATNLWRVRSGPMMAIAICAPWLCRGLFGFLWLSFFADFGGVGGWGGAYGILCNFSSFF